MMALLMTIAESTLSGTLRISLMKRGAATKTRPVDVLMRKFWPLLEYCLGVSDSVWGGALNKGTEVTKCHWRTEISVPDCIRVA